MEKFKEIIEECQSSRIEAIYNTEYKYIKEIIWDEEKNEKYGSSREGYEKYKNEMEGYATFSNEVSFRTQLSKDNKPLGYFIETKLTHNEKQNIMYDNFLKAKELLFELLEVKDKKAFEFWLQDNISIFNGLRLGANEIIMSIKELEEIYKRYNEDEEFKYFLNKIKGF